MIEKKGKIMIEKQGHWIEGGQIIDYPIPGYESMPLDQPVDYITVWVGRNDFYYKPFGYIPDDNGHIHIPIISQFAKDAGIKDGITLIRAKKLLDDYVSEKFMTDHYVKGGI